jgi:hypothetical protein
MMENEDVIVFLGPTLKDEEARRLLDADYRPPAKRGDLYRAAKFDPRIILLIDGAFESDAAVLHNEILWALSKGIKVVGAASIGSLRAAELAPFGMTGLGKIFEAYRDGGLERDDAVAVVHGPAELGYPLLSIALVDVWATLDRVLAVGLISADERDLLSEIASKIFYKRLRLETLLKAAVQLNFSYQRAEILRQHLTSHGVFSQKRADAIEALQFINRESEFHSEATTPTFVFERTSAWENLVAEQDEHQTQVRTEGLTFTTEHELAMIGLVLAEKEAQQQGFILGQTEFEEAARKFRLHNKLNRFSDVERWMETAKFEHDDYVQLIKDEFFLENSRALMRQRWRNLMSRVNLHRRSALALLRK